MINIIQCNQCCSSAILVTGGAKFNWLTAGPPGKSLTAIAAEVDTAANTVSVPAPHGVTTLGEVFRKLEALGVELMDISLRKPSLDEVFLHLTGPTLTV